MRATAQLKTRPDTKLCLSAANADLQAIYDLLGLGKSAAV
jgi:hypothetical protein